MQTVPERLATLEERAKHVTTEVEKISERVDEIYEIIQRGKGAKWVITGIVTLLSGGFGAWVTHKILPF